MRCSATAQPDKAEANTFFSSPEAVDMANIHDAGWSELGLVEREAIVLRSVVEITTDLVNNEIISVHRGDGGAQVGFRTGAHRRVFGILLVDLLSPIDGSGPIASIPFLRALAEIVAEPALGRGSVDRRRRR